MENARRMREAAKIEDEHSLADDDTGKDTDKKDADKDADATPKTDKA